MNYSQLVAYLQSYLQTNDQNVIDNIPNFLAVSAARMATDIRNSLIEQSIYLSPIQVQPLPLGFVACRLMTLNGAPLTWISPKQLAEGAIGFTIQAQEIQINPAPGSDDTVQLVYYVVNLNNALANTIPHIMLHGAAAEAEMFQGDIVAATSELQLYNSDVVNSNGWDFQGSIAMGGGSAASAAGSTVTGGGSGGSAQVRAGNVEFAPAGSLQSTNVQAAIQELDSDLLAHTFNVSNPHSVTADQAGAIPMMPANVVGNVLTADGANWISAAPPGGGGGAATWGTITGTLSNQADLQAELNNRATDAELAAHTSNIANPHATTAAQVGAIPYVAPGTAGNVLASQGGVWASVTPSGAKITRSSVQVLSGANHNFALPAGCTQFELSFADMSTNGAVSPRLQLLTGASVPTTSGYLGSAVGMTTSTVIVSYTDALGMQTGTIAATNVMNGKITGTLINAATNLWELVFSGCRTDNAQQLVSSSRVQLAAVATGARLTINGTNVFDGGSASVITTAI